MAYDWIGHWKNNNIGFHLPNVNPLFEQYWPKLTISKTGSILVPLCGKTLDLAWLAHHGYYVIGVELSDIACEAFFIENVIPFKTQKLAEFTRYYSTHIELYCGDFFALCSAMLPPISAVYDRAALIALPYNLRQDYARHLTNLLPDNAEMLIITYDSPNAVKGPPYSVSNTEINALYGKHFHIEQLAHFLQNAAPKHLQAKGYEELYEAVYRLRKIVD
ncbi:MAG: thiopurine S-methyltransferase [Gammaproteobacteria bacterium]|nr:thiopurine S-methyltransferase [Gammaproteobacteria bacterium]